MNKVFIVKFETDEGVFERKFPTREEAEEMAEYYFEEGYRVAPKIFEELEIK